MHARVLKNTPSVNAPCRSHPLSISAEGTAEGSGHPTKWTSPHGSPTTTASSNAAAANARTKDRMTSPFRHTDPGNGTRGGGPAHGDLVKPDHRQHPHRH